LAKPENQNYFRDDQNAERARDWQKEHPVGSTQRRLSFCIMVPAFSRKMYLEFTLAETLGHFLSCHQPYKNWPKIFNNDSTLTSAVLDRLLHHAETVIVEGRNYRMKDQIETP